MEKQFVKVEEQGHDSKFEIQTSIREMFLNLRKQQRDHYEKNKMFKPTALSTGQVTSVVSENRYDDTRFLLKNKNVLNYKLEKHKAGGIGKQLRSFLNQQVKQYHPILDQLSRRNSPEPSIDQSYAKSSSTNRERSLETIRMDTQVKKQELPSLASYFVNQRQAQIMLLYQNKQKEIVRYIKDLEEQKKKIQNLDVSEEFSLQVPKPSDNKKRKNKPKNKQRIDVSSPASKNGSIDSTPSASSWKTPTGGVREVPEHIVEEDGDNQPQRRKNMRRLVKSLVVRDPKVQRLVKKVSGRAHDLGHTFYQRVEDRQKMSPHHKLLYVMCECRHQKETNNERFQRMVHHCNHNRESSLQQKEELYSHHALSTNAYHEIRTLLDRNLKMRIVENEVQKHIFKDMMQELKVNKIALTPELNSILVPLKNQIEEGKFITDQLVSHLLHEEYADMEFYPIVKTNLMFMCSLE